VTSESLGSGPSLVAFGTRNSKFEIRNPKSRVNDSVLSVEDLRVELPAGGGLRPAVDGVTFSLDRGEAVALVGESGCGKSQLARALLGLSPESARVTGRVWYEGHDLLSLGERAWRAVRGRRIGLVLQEPAAALDPVQTIEQQILEAIRLHRNVSRRQAREGAIAVLREVAFPDPERGLGEFPHRLSGGLRQRALLAMTLAPGPEVLIADEPTASLDATVAAQVLELLDHLRRARGLSVLLITHDLGVVAQHSDRVLVLYAGRIVEEAGTGELFEAPAHPYTRALLRSVPRVGAFGSRGARLPAIAGAVADLGNRPRECCAFAPRCPDRFSPCDRSEPPLYAAGRSRARCFLYGPGGVAGSV
jgi:peptide/nickel transport system ATP-binding protein